MEKTLNESIIKIRVNLQKSKLKKSGKNKYAGFEYFELADFLPKLNELMLEEKINDLFTIDNNIAKLTLIKGEEKQEYSMPFIVFATPLNKDGKPSMQDIQYLGALNTYYKRYLYLNAFGITDGDVIDSMNNEELIKENYRDLLIAYCKENEIDMNEIGRKYKLNSKSKNEEFKNVYDMLKKTKEEESKINAQKLFED